MKRDYEKFKKGSFLSEISFEKLKLDILKNSVLDLSKKIEQINAKYSVKNENLIACTKILYLCQGESQWNKQQKAFLEG